MAILTRRSVLRGSLALGAAGTLAHPYIANAAATTATVWQVQGFFPEEDAAFKKVVADYEKASGNKIDYSIMPFMALNQKTVSALTSGDAPDLIFHDAPETLLPQNAWNDTLLDVSDVVETQKSKLSATALDCASYYNNAKKAHAFYLCPIKQACAPFHIWGDLVEKADSNFRRPQHLGCLLGFLQADAEGAARQGDAQDVFPGLQVTTVGPNDGNNLFAHFMFANGGVGIVSRDGKLHTDDPKIREAAIKSITWMTTAYRWLRAARGIELERCRRQQRLPRKAVPDGFRRDAFHRTRGDQQGQESLSRADGGQGTTERQRRQANAAAVGAGGGFIPKGAKNAATAKDYMKYFMQPEVMNENLKNGLGRWVPAIPELVKSDPFWLDPDPHRATYVTEAVLGRPSPATIATIRLRPGPGGTGMGHVPCRCNQERDDAGGGGGQGVQTSRGDLHEIHILIILVRRA
jgi:multiple sugar transport system substrate-binding protein